MLVVFAILFLFVLVFLKHKSNQANSPLSNKNLSGDTAGLSYSSETLESLINKDSDKDGVLDWEESLWGTDPNNRETTPGTPDETTISKLKQAQGTNTEGGATFTASDKNLTETDRFSREFLTTVSALNQNGDMDQASMDKLGSALADKIRNSTQRKTWKTEDLKVVQSDTSTVIKKYIDAFNNTTPKNPTKYSVIDVLNKFSADENAVDTSVLVELNPILKQTTGMLVSLSKLSVPQTFVSIQLEFMNELQGSVENLEDLKKYDTDPIVALSGISKYQQNTEALEITVTKFQDLMQKKLSN